MMGKVAELASRRQMLLLESERLRNELRLEQERLQYALGRMDRALSFFQRLKAHPALLALGAALLSRLLRRRRRREAAARVGWGARLMLAVSLGTRALALFRAVRPYAARLARR